MKESTAETKPDHRGQKEWTRTSTANLVRYSASGIYFARVRLRGKLFRKSLDTDVLSVARLRLADFIKAKREELGDDRAVRSGKLTVGDCITIFRQRLDSKQDIKEGAKVYRRKCIDALVRSWAGLEELPVSKIGKEDCTEWASKFSAKYSPSVYNNTVGTLRMVLDVAVEKGARAFNPAKIVTKRKINLSRELHLPEQKQFEQFIAAIESAGAWCSHDCANLVRFLAYGGFRKTEASFVTWDDCDFERGVIQVRVTKNGKARKVPMIPDMKRLLENLKEQSPLTKPTDPVMTVRECQKAMDRAAKIVGMERITHHDLRHLFATHCIESGVDIPTVSRWLGHSDGGALAMKVYGHLRDEHSADMAQKVTFSKPTAGNIINLPSKEASA